MPPSPLQPHHQSNTPRQTRRKRQTMTPPPPTSNQPTTDLRLAFAQSIIRQDHQEVYENEVISAIQFNGEGDLLAVGDKGGMVQVYKRDHQFRTPTYGEYISFQSHHPDFDYLKSIEIEEKITQLKWLRDKGPANYLLAANDRTIKLWRIGESRKPEYTSSSKIPTSLKLTIPRPQPSISTLTSSLRKTYNNGHTFHINTISVNSDGQTFASADDLRINLWDTDRTDTSFVIVDEKPENMENLNEVITTCSFHPKSCNILSYSTSRGSTKLCDMRASATCDKAIRHFREDTNGYKGFFVEVVHSVSDAQFSNCGTCIATRDFMSVKIWDTRMESSSLLNIPVHDFLQPHLTTMYENDLIFDKFTVTWSPSDKCLVTGSYHDLFCLAEPSGGKTSCKSSLFQMSEDYKDCSRHHMLKPKRIVSGVVKLENPLDDIKLDEMELSKRVLISQWHPKENILAVASCNALRVFDEKRPYFDDN